MNYNCRVCGKEVEQFLDLGQQPIANRFLKPNDKFEDEYFYHLVICYCGNCHSVQSKKCPEPDKVFNDDYPFFTSSSNHMKNHFKQLAEEIKGTSFSNKFIVEIGSNNGTFLRHFKNQIHLGIEPSKSVYEDSIFKGVQAIKNFFTEEIAMDIVGMMGKADVVVSTNAFPHIEDRHSFLRGVKSLLSDDGIWIDEEVYLGDIISKVSYDQFYNEHVFYATLASYTKLLDMFDLQIRNYKFINVHGGSIRFYIGHKKKGAAYYSTEEDIHYEKLTSIDSLKDFAKKVKKSRNNLLITLNLLKEKGETVVGYGATAKSATILNYCGIDQNLISCIYDTTPCKHNTVSPGMHIPIVPYERFFVEEPKNVVLFAWNHINEIQEKEKERNINWIMPI